MPLLAVQGGGQRDGRLTPGGAARLRSRLPQQGAKARLQAGRGGLGAVAALEGDDGPAPLKAGERAEPRQQPGLAGGCDVEAAQGVAAGRAEPGRHHDKLRGEGARHGEDQHLEDRRVVGVLVAALRVRGGVVLTAARDDFARCFKDRLASAPFFGTI